MFSCAVAVSLHLDGIGKDQPLGDGIRKDGSAVVAIIRPVIAIGEVVPPVRHVCWWRVVWWMVVDRRWRRRVEHRRVIGLKQLKLLNQQAVLPARMP